MSRLEFIDIKIVFHDHPAIIVEHTTRQSGVSDGVLHLFKKNGEYAEEQHLGSFPLSGIKAWYRRPSFGLREEWPE